MTLYWINVPPGWRCEIKTSDGRIQPWDGSRPIGETCRFRVWHPSQRDTNDEWLTPGEFLGVSLADAAEDVAFWAKQGASLKKGR